MYSDPKLKDAFKKSIKFYFANQEPKKYNEAVKGKRKYDKKYFDGLESELFPKEKEPKKAKKQKKEALNATL
jgi:hypothetical protein